MSLIGEKVDRATVSQCTEVCIRRVLRSFVSVQPVEASPGQIQFHCPVENCETVANLDVQLRPNGQTVPVGIRFEQTEAECTGGFVG